MLQETFPPKKIYPYRAVITLQKNKKKNKISNYFKIIILNITFTVLIDYIMNK